MLRRPALRSRIDAAAVVLVLALALGPIACGPARPKPDEAKPAAAAIAADRHPYLVLRLKERRLYVMSDDPAHTVESFPIAVGRKGRETPTGRFQIDEMVENPDFPKIDPNDRTRVVKLIPPGPENPLGARWMTFVRGDGWTIGIHGTPRPELLGQAVSGGCIRMRNADVIRVYDRVRLGTTVVVEP